jgi:hypothetical protein
VLRSSVLADNLRALACRHFEFEKVLCLPGNSLTCTSSGRSTRFFAMSSINSFIDCPYLYGRNASSKASLRGESR